MHHSDTSHTVELIPSAEGLMCQYVIVKFNQTDIARFPDANICGTNLCQQVGQRVFPGSLNACPTQRTTHLPATRLAAARGSI